MPRTTFRLLWYQLLVTFLPITSCNKSDPFQETLNAFQIEEGLRIELVAAEPLVIDPVALAFDENRRLYVVENRGYPDPAEGGSPTSQGIVSLLKDTDGDGYFDHRTEFATGFTYPNGVVPWRGGVFVTCAPDIYYLKDTTGDGIADLRKVVLTGFNDTKTSQIRMGTPTLGIDGWVYVTGGLNGGSVSSPKYPDREAVTYTSADGRFHPDTFEFQVTGGKSQFGLTINPYGDRFGCSNRHPVQHIVLEPWYLDRNKHLSFSESVNHVSQVESNAVVFPISDIAITADFVPKLIGRSHKGTFTSACGILAFHGTGLMAEHQSNVFICEPAQNLVQRQVLHQEVASYNSDLAYEGKEFLASTDTWFNPVFLQPGPEGALYLADMHRKVIDHPSYIPEEARNQMDFESGKNKGRIYRITRLDFEAGNVVDMDIMTPSEHLVSALESPEEWVRSTAHRLLLERSDMASISFIKSCAIQAPLAESRIRALGLLRSFGALDIKTVKTLLNDQRSEVRAQAILAAEYLFETHSELVPVLVATADDPSAKVRFNGALVLGSLEGPEVVQGLARIAVQDGADRWTRAAILSGIGDRVSEFTEVFSKQPILNTEAFSAMMKHLGQLLGNTASEAECRSFFKQVLNTKTNSSDLSTILGLASGFASREDINPTSNGLLYSLLGENPSRTDRQALERFIIRAKEQAIDMSASIQSRVSATALLGYTNFDVSGTVLRSLLVSVNPPEVQIETISTLTRLEGSQSGQLLTEKDIWSGFTPRVRVAAMNALVSKPELIESLFNAIEQKTITPTEISFSERQRLIQNKDPKVKQRAIELFKDIENGSRREVYNKYLTKLDLEADPAQGKRIFTQVCGTCHTYEGVGGDVGPDLTGVKHQPVEALLLHTLIPNYEVYPEFQAISIEMNDGRVLTGRLLSETENSLTLRTTFGTDEAILRTSINSINNSARSLMPDGLEQNMTLDEVSALIAYIKSGG